MAFWDSVNQVACQVYDTGNCIKSAELNKSYPEIIDAYFARKRYKAGDKFAQVQSGEGLEKLAARLGTDVESLKKLNSKKLKTWKNNVQGFLANEIIKYEDTQGKKRVYFSPLEGANIGSEVYLVVKTTNFRNKKIIINIKQGKENFLFNEHEVMPVLQNGAEVNDIELTVGDLCNDPNIANPDEYADNAIAKVQLRPKSDDTFKAWKDKFEDVQTKQTSMYIYVDAGKENADVPDESIVYYGGAGEESDSTVTDGGYWGYFAKIEKRVFLDLNPRWFKLGHGNFCLKLGDKNKLIQEINIRLMGFGGNVPTLEFTKRTLNMINQFQKHFMKIEPTGHICGETLKAIDKFGSKFKVNFSQIKCPCGNCTGFGKGKYAAQRQDASIKYERKRKYEYPGIHRSMYWSVKAVQFWMNEADKNLKYSLNKISSGYRCWYNNNHNKPKARTSTNHMGKALDLHFNKNGKRTRKLADIEEIRLKIFSKRMGAPATGTGAKYGFGWKRNMIGMESKKFNSGSSGATTWVHYDIREFDLKYLKDEFFTKTSGGAEGKTIVEMAKEMGYLDTVECKCNCPKDASGGAISSN